jgi:succinate dehydrogenase / fumarate reductase, membrane anchor subunit
MGVIMNQRFNRQSPLGKVRGLGSAKSGVSHFLIERFTGLMLVPLGLWLVYSMITVLMDGSYATLVGWLSSSLVMMLMMLFILMLFWHSSSGVQVIIEDYVHKQPWSALLLILNKALHLVLAIITALAVLKLHLAPAALT